MVKPKSDLKPKSKDGDTEKPPKRVPRAEFRTDVREED